MGVEKTTHRTLMGPSFPIEPVVQKCAKLGLNTENNEQRMYVACSGCDECRPFLQAQKCFVDAFWFHGQPRRAQLCERQK